MRKISIFLLIFSFAFGLNLRIENFSSDLYSKNGLELKKLNLELEITGRDVLEYKFAIYDTLNVIIGSFYIEDIMTSSGKENFKKTLIQYANKKYGVDIDEVFIIKLSMDNKLDIDKIVKAIKEQGCN